MKNISMLMVLAAVLMTALTVSAQTPTGAAATAVPALVDVRYADCPLMGGKALSEVATIHANKVYHFCCPSCIGEFQKDPAAAIAKIKDAKEVPLTVTNPEGTCPVCGKTSSPEFFLIRGDSITFYFCKDCIGKDTPKAVPSAAPASGAAVPAPAAAPSAAADSAGSSECGDCSTCGGCPSTGN